MTIREKMEQEFGRQTLERVIKAGEFFDAVDAITEAFQGLKARVEMLESHGVRYCGVWQRALPYRKGSLVTSSGALWVCLAEAPEGVMPGTNPSIWQLAQKSIKPTKRVRANGRPSQ